MKIALERHAAGEALVVPVILRPVDWQATPFGVLQALPRDGKPVTTFENIDIAFEQVATNLRAAIQKLLKNRRGITPAPAVVPMPSPEVPAAVVDSIAKLLTHYMGPIARVVVRGAASRCRGVPELCEAVAVEIANLQDRSRFLAEAYKLNAHDYGKVILESISILRASASLFAG